MNSSTAKMLNLMIDTNTQTDILNLEGLASEPIDLRIFKKEYKDIHPPGRRVAPRYEITMDVILFTHTKSFRTTSVNVSASGALLKDLLPDEFMKGSLDIIFILKTEETKRRMIFRGKAVGGPLRSSRITFQHSVLNSQRDLMLTVAGLTPISNSA